MVGWVVAGQFDLVFQLLVLAFTCPYLCNARMSTIKGCLANINETFLRCLARSQILVESLGWWRCVASVYRAQTLLLFAHGVFLFLQCEQLIVVPFDVRILVLIYCGTIGTWDVLRDDLSLIWKEWNHIFETLLAFSIEQELFALIVKRLRGQRCLYSEFALAFSFECAFLFLIVFFKLLAEVCVRVVKFVQWWLYLSSFADYLLLFWQLWV